MIGGGIGNYLMCKHLIDTVSKYKSGEHGSRRRGVFYVEFGSRAVLNAA
jgi:hypothetical protein